MRQDHENHGGGAGAVATGQGAFTRKIDLYDFDLTWMLTNRLAVVGMGRRDYQPGEGKR